MTSTILKRLFIFFCVTHEQTQLAGAHLVSSSQKFRRLTAETRTPAEVERTVCWVSGRAQREFIIFKRFRDCSFIKGISTKPGSH